MNPTCLYRNRLPLPDLLFYFYKLPEVESLFQTYGEDYNTNRFLIQAMLIKYLRPSFLVRLRTLLSEICSKGTVPEHPPLQAYHQKLIGYEKPLTVRSFVRSEEILLTPVILLSHIESSIKCLSEPDY